ncbi:hypothetical protein Tco_0580057, partial [Tanacetum coccineum]
MRTVDAFTSGLKV